MDLVFSPMVHFGTPQIEGFLGPKIGVFGMTASEKSAGTSSFDAHAQGLTYGFNLGVAIPVGNIAIGGLLAYTGRHITKRCNTQSGQAERCTTSPSDDELKLLSIAGAVLF